MVYVSLCVTRPVPWGPELRRGLDPKGSGPRVITKYRVRQRREHGIHSAISRETDTVPYSVRLRNVGSDDGLRTMMYATTADPSPLPRQDNTNPHTAVRLNETPQGLIDVMTGGIVL